MPPLFEKLLVANRGEIAVRVMRTCREMGIRTVAVFSEADRDALHVRVADEAYCVGPAPSAESYLRIDRIIEVAKQTGAQAVHPGYGFLSENAKFATALAEAGITFVGPSAESITAMGEKTLARGTMMQAGVPVVPGSKDAVDEAGAIETAKEIGFPVLIKAAAGGGGKGMRKVTEPAELEKSVAAARREAETAFGDGRVYVERYCDSPRHIEIQVMCDTHGNSVYLGERECSVQRRHQKVIEESPSPVLTQEMRKAMGEVAVKAAQAVDYVGAGTVEFILDKRGDQLDFYFMEMNTRLQVEHPVTEECFGVDLVRAQIEVAAGLPLRFGQEDLVPRGHAVECRIYAEDPDRNFMPSPGKLEAWRPPEGPGVRVDGGIYPGYEVPSFYDPMVAKLVTWAENREAAIERMQRALHETVLTGIRHNIEFHRAVLAHPAFKSGDYTTHFIDDYREELKPPASDLTPELQAAAAALAAHMARAQKKPQGGSSAAEPTPSAWKRLGRQDQLR